MRAQSAHAAGRPRLWGYELNLEIERVVSLRWRWANEDERLEEQYSFALGITSDDEEGVFNVGARDDVKDEFDTDLAGGFLATRILRVLVFFS